MIEIKQNQFFNCELKNNIKCFMLRCTEIDSTTLKASNMNGIIELPIIDIISINILTNVGICIDCKVTSFTFQTYADGRCTTCHNKHLKHKRAIKDGAAKATSKPLETIEVKMEDLF